MKYYYPLLILIVLLLCGCDESKNIHRQIYKDFVGKEILIPSEIQLQILAMPVKLEKDRDFTIVSYVDSDGCVPCRMHLGKWRNFINEVKAIVDIDVNFLMILESDDNFENQQNLKAYKFIHPIAFDKRGIFRKLNSLPKENIYHTFLLDSDNKILAIGNPSTNPKIKELYLNILKNETEGFENDYSPASLHSYCVGAVLRDDTVKATYKVANSSGMEMTVSDIASSCDCVDVIITKDTVLPNEEVEVEMRWKVDSDGEAFRQYSDVYFNEQQNPVRLVMYGYITKNN